MNGLNEKWNGVALGAVLLFVFLLYISVFYNTVPEAEKEYNNFKEIIIKKGNPSSKIALIKIEGDIDGVLAESVVKIIENIQVNKNIKGLILEINSNGGFWYPSYIMAKTILELREKKPVISNIMDGAFSGAYIVASAANRVISSEISVVGNIGIWRAITINNDKKSNKKIFFAGKYKVIFQNSIDEVFKKSIQSIVDKDYERIIKIIAEGRKTNEEEIKKVAQGLFYRGYEAKKLGLVDEVMDNSRTKVIECFTKEWELRNPSIVEFRPNRADGLNRFNELFEELIEKIDALKPKK